MRVHDIKTRSIDELVELSAIAVLSTGKRFQPWFRFPKRYDPWAYRGDPFLAGLLVPCMFAGETIHIDAPVSQRLLEAVPRIQEVISDWDADCIQVEVSSSRTHRGSQGKPGASAVFFSAGVDSLYSLCKHRQEASHLVLIHGLENPVFDRDLLQQTLTSIRVHQQLFGKELVTVYTNLRSVADQSIAPWGRLPRRGFFGFRYMGSLLAAAGLCLQDGFGRLFIPASYCWDTLVPYGSHPDLDPMWSSEDLTFEHDGCESSRLEKIKHIAAAVPAALAHLQVCESNLPCETNCCSCDKCLRTMLALRLNGLLDKSCSFNKPLRLDTLVKRANRRRWRRDYQDLLTEARQRGDGPVEDALCRLLEKRLCWQTVRRLGVESLFPFLGVLPPWLRSRFRSQRSRRW